MIQLPEKVEQSIHARGLLRRGDSVLVGVSGGVDSMVLLFVLHQLAAKNSWKLRVAHLNHRLRGRSSDADERLVVRTAERLRLPVVTGRADIKRLALKRGVSIEMAAREARHAFLARAAARSNIKTIALAHHADDQVELFFLRVLRGSGGEGLSGMKWRGRSPAHPKIQLVRPLLGQAKSELHLFAREEGIPFRDDLSNRSTQFLRNRVRHELLPLLKRRYQPAIERTILRLMDIAAADAECVAAIAEDWLRGPGVKFGSLAAAVQRRCVHLQLLREQIDPDFGLIERLRLRLNSPVPVSPRRSAVLDDAGKLRVMESPAATTHPGRLARNVNATAAEVLKVKVGQGGQATFGGLQIAWTLRKAKPRAARPKSVSGRETFDADCVGPEIIFRHWQPGDRFQPIGMKAAVKLQDLFTNRKIPRARRHELVLAETSPGELFWVENIRISERFKLSNKTVRQLDLRWKRL